MNKTYLGMDCKNCDYRLLCNDVKSDNLYLRSHIQYLFTTYHVTSVLKYSYLVELIETIGESRNQELKGSISWKDPRTKFKITKSLLAMSNIRNGGRIIIGVNENQGSYTPVGMTESDFESFNQDDVYDYTAKYIHPYAKFKIEKITNETKRFLIISIDEFEEFPLICRKSYHLQDENGVDEIVLHEGEICTRTVGAKPQSSKVMSMIDLQEIIKLAIEKGVKSFVEKANKAGISYNPNAVLTDEMKFEKQISDL